MANNKQPSWRWIAIAILAVVAILTGLILWKPWVNRNISDFQSCKDAGGALLESYPEQCMLHGKSFTNTAQSVDTSDTNAYIGLAEQAALDKAKADKKAARVVERDGESLPVTMDYSLGRLNFHVKDGKVYRVQVEGKDL